MTFPAQPRTGEQAYRDRYAQPWDRVARVTHCVDCFPGNCPLVAYVRDGVVVREEAAANLETVEEGVPDANPMVCQKGLAWSRQLYSPDRITTPLRRAGERGEGRWEPISWDEALTEVADAIIDAIEESGPESVVHEVSPEISVVVPATRFMRTIAGTMLDVDGSINDFWSGFQQVFGKFTFTPSVDDWFHSDVIFMWHANPAYTMIPSFHYVTEARYRGAHVVLVSPDVNPSHSHADFHVPVKHGTDAALALAIAQVVIEEGLADLTFVREQTDLSFLVRTDTDAYLRESDLDPQGRDDAFYQWDPGSGAVPAGAGNLRLDFEAVLEGTLDATLAGGETVTIEPLFARLRRMLDDLYTPEAVEPICGTNPDTVRTIARLVAAGRSRILTGAGLSKYFHGDLMARAMLLMLAVTGNWGKKGAGTGGWCTGMFDGQTIAMSKMVGGVTGAEQVVNTFEMVTGALRQADPTITEELAAVQLFRGIAATAGMSPPAFFWYWHAGYKDRWNDPSVADPSMKRPFDDYFREAVDKGWWGAVARPGPDHPPRVLIEIGGNMLRRQRGGQTVLLEHLWPQLDKIVAVDFRMSQTALHADLVLPAAQHYEKVDFGMPTPWTMTLGFSDEAVPPRGEARAEWTMLAELCRAIERRAAERGLESFVDAGGMAHRYDDLWSQYTLGGSLESTEALADEMVRDAVFAGSMPPGTSLETLRAKGWEAYTEWGMMAMVKNQASPFPRGETHSPLRNHVENGDPYPTLTRRAQFLVDHAWYQEAGEDLPVHKDAPPMGGSYPFRLSSGHNRWSIHAMNTTNPVLLQTHRGKPFLLVNDRDAEALGIADDALVHVWNDVGDFRVHARVSPAQRPGALTVYNGFEGFMFPGGRGPNEVEPGLVKWLHLVGDYGHLTYTPTAWQPVPFDRCVFVDMAPDGEGGA